MEIQILTACALLNILLTVLNIYNKFYKAATFAAFAAGVCLYVVNSLL